MTGVASGAAARLLKISANLQSMLMLNMKVCEGIDRCRVEVSSSSQSRLGGILYSYSRQDRTDINFLRIEKVADSLNKPSASNHWPDLRVVMSGR